MGVYTYLGSRQFLIPTHLYIYFALYIGYKYSLSVSIYRSRCLLTNVYICTVSILV
jgi:hypothetical protein